jgi:phospholipid/cholesterol/gamma-HCH transport system permease protein
VWRGQLFFDPAYCENYVAGMNGSNPAAPPAPTAPSPRHLMPAPPSRAFAGRAGHSLIAFLATARGLIAFSIITFGVFITKFGVARDVTFPAIYHEQARSGKQVLPMFLFISAALGLVVIGQTISLLKEIGATAYLGPIMVAVVVRELGPLLTAMLVLARSGTRNVIELGTARALGEVEALEALRIDPIHYLVMPRVIGMGMAVFSLTIYFIIGTLVSGYLFAFVTNVPLRPDEYVHQLTDALSGLDFVVLAIKSSLFGVVIAIITCYHGLAQPLRLEEVSRATIRAVAQSVVACVLLDAVFIVVYLFA